MRQIAAFIAAALLSTVPVTAQTADVPYSWNNVTVGGGGFAPNIIFSPAEKGLAYLRTDMGGAYRWDFARQRWIALEDQFAQSSYFGIESIALDPHNPNVVYLAAGIYEHDPAAILRSSDRGATWSVTPVPFRMGGNEDGRGMGERLAVDPHHSSTLLFGSRNDGLWRSDDSGKSWHKVERFPWPGLGIPTGRAVHGGISFVVFDPRSTTVYAAVADPADHHLFRSTDGGESWSAVPGGPPPPMLPVKAALDSSGNLFVDYCDGIGPNGISKGAVWKLETTSGRWTNITPDRRTDGGYMGLSVDRMHPGRLAVSTVDRWHRDTVWLSADSGRHWTSLRERSSLDVSASPFLKFEKAEADFGHWMSGLAFDPFDGSTLVYTTGATVMRTLNSGSQQPTWRPWVNGIEQTAVITLISPTGGAPLISGFGDIAGFVHDRVDVSPPHMHLRPFLPNTNNLDYAGLTPNVVVRSGSIQSREEEQDVTLAWSGDGGHVWAPLKAPPVHGSKRMDLRGEAPITVSADGATFFVSGAAVLATSDRGQSWWTPTGLPPHSLAVPDKADPQLVFAVDFAGSRLLVSRDGGHAFAIAAGRGLPGRFKRVGRTDREAQPALQASPQRAGELWFLLGSRLYHSVNAGRSFVSVAPADFSVNLFGLGAPAPGARTPSVYAIAKAADLEAVWRSIDAGRTWSRINDDRDQWGLRFRAISGDPKQFGRVYIATDGRGILYGDPLR